MTGPEPSPSPLEVETQLRVKMALAQDAALKAVRRATPPAPGAPVDAEAEQRRNWALQEARAAVPARQIGGEARLIAWVNPDGSTNIRTDPGNPNRTLATTVYTDTPVIVHECTIVTDEEEAALYRQQREAENTLLATQKDVAEMVAAGIMSADEAAHPGVKAAAAASARRVAGREAPYDLVNSVR